MPSTDAQIAQECWAFFPTQEGGAAWRKFTRMPKGMPTANRTERIVVRFTRREDRLIQTAARQHGITVTDFVRCLLLPAADLLVRDGQAAKGAASVPR